MIKLIVWGAVFLSAIGGGIAVSSINGNRSLNSSDAGWTIKGPVSSIASPKDFKGTGPLFKPNFDIQKPHYYVVQGQKVYDHYEFPVEVTAKKGGRVVSMLLQRNTSNNTELIEVGVPTDASWKASLHTPDGGTTTSSTVPLKVKPVNK